MLPKNPKTSIALVLTLSAIAAPAANAMLPRADPPCPGCSYNVVAHPPNSSSPAIVDVESSTGFDWLDAGIGAAGGIAISIVGVGGALTVSQRRERRSRNSAPVVS